MDLRQVVHSASRSMVRPSSLFYSATTTSRSVAALILRQQQHQRRNLSSESTAPSSSSTQQATTNTSTNASSFPAPRRSSSSIDNIIGGASTTTPRASILSSPRGAGLSSLLPPRPPRIVPQRTSTPPPPTANNPWAIPALIEKEFAAAAEITNIKRSTSPISSPTSMMTSWSEAEFKQRYGIDRVENIRLSPSVGRLVHVSGTADAKKALERLNTMCSRNALRHTVNMQKYHERPALRRKRRLREAWRKRFMTGFKAVVSRTLELRKQGW